MQKALIVIGLLIVLVGVFYPFLSRLPFGRLPGDIFYKNDNVSFAFPIVTCIILSIVITIIVNLLR